jgi:hypothetical protein
VHHPPDSLVAMRSEARVCLDIALACGLNGESGRAALRIAMERLDATDTAIARSIYTPRAGNPRTRKHAPHLDSEINSLMSDIDALRTRILEASSAPVFDPDLVEAATQRLSRQLGHLLDRETRLISLEA